MNWFKLAEEMPRELKCCLCGMFCWWEALDKDGAHPKCAEHILKKYGKKK